MNFHHIGVACKSIDSAINTYKSIGYKIKNNKIIIDPIQKVRLCVLFKKSHPLIELIEPNKINSPVSRILKLNGPSPYHTCYEVDNIDLAINMLKKLNFILINKPVPAKLFDNRLICFFTIVILVLLNYYKKIIWNIIFWNQTVEHLFNNLDVTYSNYGDTKIDNHANTIIWFYQLNSTNRASDQKKILSII